MIVVYLWLAFNFKKRWTKSWPSRKHQSKEEVAYKMWLFKKRRKNLAINRLFKLINFFVTVFVDHSSMRAIYLILTLPSPTTEPVLVSLVLLSHTCCSLLWLTLCKQLKWSQVWEKSFTSFLKAVKWCQVNQFEVPF